MTLKCFSDKQSDLIQFTLRSDVMVMAASPLKPMEVCNDKYTEIDLPSIHPMHYTISLGKTNFYRFEDIYRKFNLCNLI